MIPRHLLTPDDFEWALDNSRRLFRVIPLDVDDEGQAHLLRVVPLDGTQPVVMGARCGLFPGDWEDTDHYAAARLNAIRMGARARQQGGAR